MNNQNLIIYDFPILFEILTEIEENLNFKIINYKKNQFSNDKLKELENYLVISNKENSIFKDLIIIDSYPIELFKLIENINIRFLKKKY